MTQDVITLIIVVAAGSYTLIQGYRLFRKPRRGNVQKSCHAGCSSCNLKNLTS